MYAKKSPLFVPIYQLSFNLSWHLAARYFRFNSSVDPSFSALRFITLSLYYARKKPPNHMTGQTSDLTPLIRLLYGATSGRSSPILCCSNISKTLYELTNSESSLQNDRRIFAEWSGSKIVQPSELYNFRGYCIGNALRLTLSMAYWVCDLLLTSIWYNIIPIHDIRMESSFLFCFLWRCKIMRLFAEILQGLAIRW